MLVEGLGSDTNQSLALQSPYGTLPDSTYDFRGPPRSGTLTTRCNLGKQEPWSPTEKRDYRRKSSREKEASGSWPLLPSCAVADLRIRRRVGDALRQGILHSLCP